MITKINLVRDLLSTTATTDKVIAIYYRSRSILQITLAGFVEITSLFLEDMQKSGFVFRSIQNLIDLPALPQNLGISDEDDVPRFVWTIIRFKDTELSPIEHGDDYFALHGQTKESKAEDVNLEANSPIHGGVNN